MNENSQPYFNSIGFFVSSRGDQHLICSTATTTFLLLKRLKEKFTMRIEKRHFPIKFCDNRETNLYMNAWSGKRSEEYSSVDNTDDHSKSVSTENAGEYSICVYDPVRKNTTSNYMSFDLLLTYISNESKLVKQYRKKYSTNQQPSSLRLCGGGEQALNNGTSGWGSPPAASSMGKYIYSLEAIFLIYLEYKRYSFYREQFSPYVY